MNQIKLDVEKAQEKCGTCGNWKRIEGINGQCNVGFCPFACTEDSLCYFSNSHHYKPIPNPEESLEALRRKQRDIVGVDTPSTQADYEQQILELESQINRMAFDHGKIVRELAEKTKDCDTYMKQYQKELAIRLEIKKLANKEK